MLLIADKTNTNSCQAWILANFTNAAPAHSSIQHRQMFWYETYRYPHVYKFPENILKYLYGGTFEKCKLFFETHCMDVRKSPKSNRALHPLLEINNIWQNYPVQTYSALQIAVIKWSLIKLQTANELTTYKGWAMYQLIKINTYLTFLKLYQYSPRSDWVPFAGESPAKWDFPRQSHSVDARRDFSRWSHQRCWVRRGESDLGLVIDIAQLFSSNVRMR